jgi:hypothetical protein
VIYSLKKMAGKQNGRGTRFFLTLGWSRDFPRSVENPLRVLGTG